MKTKSSPSLYKYCIVRLSTLAVSTLVPALKVLSTTLPERTAFSLVRTNVGPLPVFTCLNSTTDQSWLPMLRTMPFLRSLVEAKRMSLSYDGQPACVRRCAETALLPVEVFKGIAHHSSCSASSGPHSRTRGDRAGLARSKLTGPPAPVPEGDRQRVPRTGRRQNGGAAQLNR